MLKSERGITVLLLVITIIVLLIIGSAAAAAGISTYKESKVKVYLKEMDAIEEKVSLYAEKTNVDSNKSLENLGSDVDSSDSAKEVLTALGVSADEYSNYRFLSSSKVSSELGLENISKDIIINIENKKVYSISPITYNNEEFYSAEDLRNSLK